ncbi:MAG TPA: hypothetical protein PLY87_29280, partial [Planctomycetaceae bacterium]|nr:hypothetical protein [Planctomycetaceae bacterium]
RLETRREAIFQTRTIYRRLLNCVADVAKELGETSGAPFQHIVTTTTPPPTRLNNKNTVRLKLGGVHGQLFGRQLQSPSTALQRTLLSDGDHEV